MAVRAVRPELVEGLFASGWRALAMQGFDRVLLSNVDGLSPNGALNELWLRMSSFLTN
jgi:hypothetical protein